MRPLSGRERLQEWMECWREFPRERLWMRQRHLQSARRMQGKISWCFFRTAENAYGATLVPIFQSGAFQHESAEQLEKIFDNRAMGFSYTRINNPTIDAFEKKITKLDVTDIAAVAEVALEELDDG